jgi:CRISPR/Cas system CSM-associated protein Csm3 (group 7 of RAMP superfamily)
MRHIVPRHLLKAQGTVKSDYLHIGAGVRKPFSLRRYAPTILQLLKEVSVREVISKVKEMRFRLKRGSPPNKHEFFKINGIYTIPASSIKGAIRAYAGKILGKEQTRYLFGTPGNPSMLNFTNAPIHGKAEWKRIRRRIRERDLEEEYELMPRGSTFEFKVLVRSVENVDTIKKILTGKVKIGAMKDEELRVENQKKTFGLVELSVKEVREL